jgi:hypothetical protein
MSYLKLNDDQSFPAAEDYLEALRIALLERGCEGQKMHHDFCLEFTFDNAHWATVGLMHCGPDDSLKLVIQFHGGERDCQQLGEIPATATLKQATDFAGDGLSFLQAMINAGGAE